METVSAPSRARRYERRKEPPAFQLTQRDLRILAHVARHRFLSSEHLMALDGGSRQNLLRCLRVLFDHGYLDRPYAQLAHLPISGPRPMIYGLGRRGAQALAAHRGTAAGDTDWTERNKRAGALFIQHTIAIANFMVGLELACRKSPDFELLREEDIIADAPEATRLAREPLRVAVPGLSNKIGVSSVVADGLFGLEFPDDTASYFMLEMDRGSMPVVRSRMDQTSFARKLKVYWEAWKARQHVEQFGLKQFRVLTVTESAERVDRMIGTVYDLTNGRGSNLFLFAEKSRFYGRLPTEVWWTSGKRELVRVID